MSSLLQLLVFILVILFVVGLFGQYVNLVDFSILLLSGATIALLWFLRKHLVTLLNTVISEIKEKGISKLGKGGLVLNNPRESKQKLSLNKSLGLQTETMATSTLQGQETEGSQPEDKEALKKSIEQDIAATETFNVIKDRTWENDMLSRLSVVGDKEEQVKILMRYFVMSQWALQFEKIDKEIRLGHLTLLNSLDMNREGMTLELLELHYKELAKKYPFSYKDYSFTDYLFFLSSRTLITSENNLYRITKLGVDYLTYIFALNYLNTHPYPA